MRPDVAIQYTLDRLRGALLAAGHARTEIDASHLLDGPRWPGRRRCVAGRAVAHGHALSPEHRRRGWVALPVPAGTVRLSGTSVERVRVVVMGTKAGARGGRRQRTR